MTPLMEDEVTEFLRLHERPHRSLRTELEALTSEFETVWVPSIHGLSQHGDESWSGLPWIPRGLPHRVTRLSPSDIDDPLQSILKIAKK